MTVLEEARKTLQEHGKHDIAKIRTEVLKALIALAEQVPE